MPSITNKTSWHPLSITDLRTLGQDSGKCERCGKKDLRFVHVIKHPSEGLLTVGSECAKRMCYGYDPEREESRLRNLWTRRSRWLTRNWGTSWKGNPTLKIKHEGESIRVTVFSQPSGRFVFSIANKGKPFYSSEFTTADAAKLGAFDRLATILKW